MSCAARKRGRKTLSFRLTMWYSGLFTLSVLVLFGAAYRLLSRSLQQRDREAIQFELQKYVEAYQRGGVGAVAQETGVHKWQAKPMPFVVRVVGADHATLFLDPPKTWQQFNVEWFTPTDRIAAEPWLTFPAHDGDEERIEIASARLPDGVVLQVGLHTAGREDLLEQFRTVCVVVVLLVVVIGLAGGTMLAFHTLRPLRGLVQTLQSISATGTLAARAPVANSGEELDELSRLFNTMLDKISALITGMQHTLDNVAHDLRTPMTRLRGLAEMALQADAPADQLGDALANCLEESDRVLAMLTTLMDISEAETGAMKLHLEPVRLVDLIERAVALYREVAEDKAIVVSTSALPDLSVRVDCTRMQQVLANLLDNAVKYTPPGGLVDITASRRQHQIVLTVSDTGIGIPPEDLPYIWDRLYRGDKSRSQRGLGLGLSLVKAIVQAHRGSVAASSPRGDGARFTLMLPIQPQV